MDTSRWESAVRMRAPNMFDTAVQTNKTSHIKHENKGNVLSCLIECLMAFKFYQTRPNTIKHDQTAPRFVTKQCLMVFGRQTFPVWTGLYPLPAEKIITIMRRRSVRSFVIISSTSASLPIKFVVRQGRICGLPGPGEDGDPGMTEKKNRGW